MVTTTVTDEPIAQELEDRQFQRDKIAALFKAHPLEDVSPETLKAITPHYQQRISECRAELSMYIENRRRSLTLDNGRKKRLDGAYRYWPDGKPLGRDAGTMVEKEWPTVHGRPFDDGFRLT